jgi:hypothetical protein
MRKARNIAVAVSPVRYVVADLYAPSRTKKSRNSPVKLWTLPLTASDSAAFRSLLHGITAPVRQYDGVTDALSVT